MHSHSKSGSIFLQICDIYSDTNFKMLDFFYLLPATTMRVVTKIAMKCTWYPFAFLRQRKDFGEATCVCESVGIEISSSRRPVACTVLLIISVGWPNIHLTLSIPLQTMIRIFSYSSALYLLVLSRASACMLLVKRILPRGKSNPSRFIGMNSPVPSRCHYDCTIPRSDTKTKPTTQL